MAKVIEIAKAEKLCGISMNIHLKNQKDVENIIRRATGTIVERYSLGNKMSHWLVLNVGRELIGILKQLSLRGYCTDPKILFKHISTNGRIPQQRVKEVKSERENK